MAILSASWQELPETLGLRYAHIRRQVNYMRLSGFTGIEYEKLQAERESILYIVEQQRRANAISWRAWLAGRLQVQS